MVRAASYTVEDEDSVGSTMAITPEAAAELLARRAASAGVGAHGTERPRVPEHPVIEAPPLAPPAGHPARPGKTGAPNLPPPAPPPPMPAGAELGRHGTMEMAKVSDDDDDDTGGSTMVLQAPEPGAGKRR